MTQNNKTEMNLLQIEKRKSTFEEVELGYSESEAINEAKRCLKCKNSPCREGCPVRVKIPQFITEIESGNFVKSCEIIYQDNSLPAICGRVCPQEKQCEKLCVRGKMGEPVAIGRLERFASEKKYRNQLKLEKKQNNSSKKIAIIGAGPAGLSCARELALLGYDVTIFEASHYPGGVLMYGIPEFRLPKEVVKNEIKNLEDLGVKIKLNMVVGKIITLEELMKGFSAIFISTGAGLPNFMNIPGEMLNGVYSANEFLTRINLMKSYEFPKYDTPVYVGKKTLVIGGGNVAMDAARCALRMGSDVKIVYRRSMVEIPARKAEIEHALEEGIEIIELTAPIKILGNDKGWVAGLECLKTQLIDIENSNRRGVQEIPNSNHIIEADTIIIAIGQSPNPILKNSSLQLKVDKRGKIIVDEKLMSNLPMVFAGGDAINGENTVIWAMGVGKKTAQNIDSALNYSSTTTV